MDKWKDLAGARDLLRRIVAHEVDGILPRLPPHVHAGTHMDRTAYAVGGGPDDLQTTRDVHENNVLHKNTSVPGRRGHSAATQATS